MIEINLVPDVKQELIKAQQVRATVMMVSMIVGAASIGIVTLLALFVFTVQTVRGTLVDNSIKTESKILTDVEDISKTLTIQNQLTKISDLNSNKKITSRVFSILAAIIPPEPNNVKFSTIKVDTTTNTIKIDGQALNSYAALELFKKTIEGAKVKFKTSSDDKEYTNVTLASDISTKDVSYGQDSTGKKVIRFTISFKCAEEAFSQASKDLSVVVAAKGDVTDSKLGVPNIFTNRAKDITEDK